MKEYEKVLKALANKRRLAIVKYLKDKKQSSVGGIATNIKLSLKATSKHLSILSNVDIVEGEQKSLYCFYRLSENVPAVAHRIISLL